MQLFFVSLPVDEWASATVDQWAAMLLEPMPGSVVATIGLGHCHAHGHTQRRTDVP